MPRDIAHLPAAARAARLGRAGRGLDARDAIAAILTDPAAGEVALVSSFGAEAVALLHMVAGIDRTMPVIFLDTEMLFPETLDYQREVAAVLGLADIRVIRPDPAEAAVGDPDRTLHRRDADACCALRKAAPLQRALAPFDTWITGRKRYQGGARARLDLVEPDGTARVKVNPLHDWSAADVAAYIGAHRLPRHPLVGRGYASIGCAPCTTPVARGEPARAGRWRGQDKTECGIHFGPGGPIRTDAA